MKMTVMKMLGFNNNKTILSLGLLLILQLAPSALGALTKLRSSHVVKQEEAAEPVKVLLLTEALCPGCEDFLKTTLKETYKTLGPSVMDLTIIPYGNAMIDTDKKTVECQHGLGECDANTYELCVIQSYPDPQLYVPFLTCMADKLTPGFRKDVFPPDDFQACAKENHMFWPSIAGCHCCHGYEVLAKAAQETPDHDYVPYVEINGNVMDSEADFMGTICAAFQAQGGSIAECDAHLERMSQQEHATTRITTTCPVAPTLVITSSDTTKIV